MGGGDGHIIVSDGIKQILSNPVVHGLLPSGIQKDIAGPLALDPGVWTSVDKKAMHHAFKWAMSNL
jgi:hypothetical protein